MTRQPALKEYDPLWPARAEAEAARWRAALGPTLIACHHIGSTSVPGLPAKPILDLLPEVTDLVALDAARPVIEAMGYDWQGEFGLPGRRFCRRIENGIGIAHAHCYAAGSPEITRHLAFRDYLRARPEIAADYAALKRRCAAASPDMDAYCTCKDAWIKRHETLALKAHS